MSRENLADTLSISLGMGKILQILVENQGRINFKIADDVKGIIGEVLLNNVTLSNWTITGFPLENSTQLAELVQQEFTENEIQTTEFLRTGPMIYHGTFDIEENDIVDTYINTSNWGKVIDFDI